MPSTAKIKRPAYRSVLSAAKKLSQEDRQLLRMELFGDDLIKQAMLLEMNMGKGKPPVKKTDAEIVKLVKAIRKKNYDQSKKVLY